MEALTIVTVENQ